jgi:hypothetical protein
MSFLRFEIARRICSCLSGVLSLWPRIARSARNKFGVLEDDGSIIGLEPILSHTRFRS